MRRKLILIFFLFLTCYVSGFSQKRGFDPFKEHEFAVEHKEGKINLVTCLDYTDSAVVLTDYQVKRKKYKLLRQPYYIFFDNAGAGVSFSQCDSVGVVKLDGEKYLSFSVLSKSDDRLKYTRYLYCLSDDFLYALDFYGKPIHVEGSSLGIEGVSSLELVQPSPQVSYLDSLFRIDKRFVYLSEKDYQTDKYISWWLDNNPLALKSAKTIEFGAISENCSLYDAYRNAKKSSRGNLEAAVCDIRGYTVVVVRNRKTNSHLLVWAEPECKNRKTDRYLAQVGFVDNNTISLYFYKGKTMFKYKINLVSRTLTR